MGEAGDNLFVLVNAPATHKGSAVDFDTYDKIIDQRLQQFGIDITSDVLFEQRITPQDIEQKFSAYHGSLYGLSSNGTRGAFMRPSNRSKNVHNLFFAGGSTHPGGGSPMVTLSGKLASERIVSAVAATL